MVKSEPKKKPQPGGFFQRFFRKPEKSQKEQRLTVQRSIPYLEMGRDGICRVEEHLYSKTVRFYDINYQLAQNEDKNTIFESWCDFLNYFDASIRFQLSFINHKSDMSEYNKVIQIEPQHDQFDDVRMEYAQMLKQQLAKGNNGLVRTKYITFSIEAKSVREAKPRLERIETDILNNFKVLGVKAYPLNGVERLQIMYETFHQEEQQKFDFSYDRILQSGMTTKDFIAPTSFLFKSGKDFMMGDTYGAASYLNILAPELTDKVLAEFLDMDKNLVVSIHVQSVDQLKAIKLIKGKITDLDRMKIEEQKKAVRSGYDMEIIPSDLATYGGEAKKILDDLQSRNERMFLVTVLFLNTAKTKQELDSAVFQTAGIAQKFNCTLNRLDYLQEQGLMSSLPLANNLVPIKRALTTTSTAIFVPFTTQELFMEGDSLYYGLNAVSNNMIMADRKQLKNPNGLILGTPGSGKSFSAKREITNVFFTTTDDIIVADPEGTGYRAKTRFARFFNLPELISLFKESADVQTADMLNLPVPQAEYINEVLKPSETQEEMVSSFADRAEAVRNGNVNPRFDNMLKITNDGRKLALDQRLINDMLPDEPESKVNRCVDNAFKVWEESAPDRGTQLIFAIYRHQKQMAHSTSTMMCG